MSEALWVVFRNSSSWNMDQSKDEKLLRAAPGRNPTFISFPSPRIWLACRCDPGALRELHWHANAAEWGYVVRGRVRVTAITLDGHWEAADCDEGDIFFFPRGWGHSIQGLGPDEAHFILVFDNGNFSEFGTFSSSDWIGHTPSQVLATNFGVPPETFGQFPKSEVWIVPGPVPPPLPVGAGNPRPVRFVYRMSAMEPQRFPGGTLKLVTANEFPMSSTMCGALMTIEPGSLRELHWHPAADEWQYVITGRESWIVRIRREDENRGVGMG